MSEKTSSLERISPKFDKELPPTKLYLEDLEEIEEILKHSAKKIIVRAEGYQATNLQDFLDIREDYLKYIAISATMANADGFVIFSASRTSIRLYASDSDPMKLGILSSIERVIDKRANLLRIPYRVSLTIFSLAAISQFVLLLLIFLRYIPPTSAVAIGLTIMMIVSFLGFLRTKYGVYLKYKKEYPNFWQRNQDDILKYLLFTAIGFVLGKIFP